GRRRARPKLLDERSSRATIECDRPISHSYVRGESVAQKLRPGGWKIARRFARPKSFLDKLWPFDFRPAEERVHDFDFAQPAEERQNHRLARQIRALPRQRVAPRL